MVYEKQEYGLERVAFGSWAILLRETPVPIPNTVVKPFSSDDTEGVAPWENRTLPLHPPVEAGFCLSPTSFCCEYCGGGESVIQQAVGNDTDVYSKSRGQKNIPFFSRTTNVEWRDILKGKTGEVAIDNLPLPVLFFCIELTDRLVSFREVVPSWN